MKYFLSAFLLIAFTGFANGGTQFLNLVPPSSNTVQQGFIRLNNKSGNAATVTIQGIDDSGQFGDSLLTVTIPANAAQQLNSDDLEFGNPSKNLSGALGDGDGDWRLTVTSPENVDVSGYIRTSEGFMTQMDSVTNNTYGRFHLVPMFNPASNINQVSKVRIINTSNDSNFITLVGMDDSGTLGGSPISLTLAARQSLELTASDLENGNVGKGLTGAFGDGKGKWEVSVASQSTSFVMNLLEAPGGYLSNLSTTANREASFSTLTCSDLDGARVYSTEEPPVYLGFLGAASAADSIYNVVGTYGSSGSTSSMRNSSGRYGSTTGANSHLNPDAIKPPVIVKLGSSLAYITSNTSLLGGITLNQLDSICSFTSLEASDTFELPK